MSFVFMCQSLRLFQHPALSYSFSFPQMEDTSKRNVNVSSEKKDEKNEFALASATMISYA